MAMDAPQAVADTALRYRALVLDPDGTVIRSEHLVASDDDAAIELGRALAGTHGIDLWEGPRFLEHFDPAPRPRP